MNIFISFTPYHILLSYSIALSGGNSKENYLFAISDSKQVNNLVELFKNTNPLAFRKIITLREIYEVLTKPGSRGVPSKYFYNASEVKKLRGWVNVRWM